MGVDEAGRRQDMRDREREVVCVCVPVCARARVHACVKAHKRLRRRLVSYLQAHRLGGNRWIEGGAFAARGHTWHVTRMSSSSGAGSAHVCDV